MKIFTLIMTITVISATGLSAQHINLPKFIKLQIKMSYAEVATDVIITENIHSDGKISHLSKPVKFGPINKALADLAGVPWVRSYFGRGEFEILFYFEPAHKNFDIIEITNYHQTNLAERGTLTPTKEAVAIAALNGNFPPVDYTALFDALYLLVK